MLNLIFWPLISVGAIYFVVIMLLWSYIRKSLINDVKTAILEAHEQIKKQND